MMWTISNCKTQKSSNQVTASCLPSCDLMIKCISLEQPMDDLNPTLQHLESFGSNAETVSLFWRVIFDPKWPPDAPTKTFSIQMHIRIHKRKRIINFQTKLRQKIFV